VLAAQRFEPDEGESIHTENSDKFTVDSLRAGAPRGLQAGAGLDEHATPVQRPLAPCTSRRPAE
jgi:hypothetical protein